MHFHIAFFCVVSQKKVATTFLDLATTSKHLRARCLLEKTKKKVFKKPKKACKTKWLSFNNSVASLYEDLLAVMVTLSSLPESDATGLEIAPTSGAFADKDFTFATKISPLVAMLGAFYSLAYKLYLTALCPYLLLVAVVLSEKSCKSQVKCCVTSIVDFLLRNVSRAHFFRNYVVQRS